MYPTCKCVILATVSIKRKTDAGAIHCKPVSVMPIELDRHEHVERREIAFDAEKFIQQLTTST